MGVGLVVKVYLIYAYSMPNVNRNILFSLKREGGAFFYPYQFVCVTTAAVATYRKVYKIYIYIFIQHSC